MKKVIPCFIIKYIISFTAHMTNGTLITISKNSYKNIKNISKMKTTVFDKITNHTVRYSSTVGEA